MLKRVTTAMVVAVLAMQAAAASAQTPAPAGQPPATSTQGGQKPSAQDPGVGSMTPVETRFATPTHSGDTGLWFVPTGEVLPARRWSFSVYRVNFDYTEGFTDVSNWPITFGVGLGDKAEIFGAVHAVRRIDRDARPIFFDSKGGGLANEYPYVNDGWSGSKFGDIWLGAKINLASEYRQQPVAFGVRGMLKLPTASSDDEGAGTGKADFAFDAIVSKELNERVELSGFGGFSVRAGAARA